MWSCRHFTNYIICWLSLHSILGWWTYVVNIIYAQSSNHYVGDFKEAPTSSRWLQMDETNRRHDISNNNGDSSMIKTYQSDICIVLHIIHIALHPLNKQWAGDVSNPLISLLLPGSLSKGDYAIGITVHFRCRYDIIAGLYCPLKYSPLYAQNLCISQKYSL